MKFKNLFQTQNINSSKKFEYLNIDEACSRYKQFKELGFNCELHSGYIDIDCTNTDGDIDVKRLNGFIITVY